MFSRKYKQKQGENKWRKRGGKVRTKKGGRRREERKQLEYYSKGVTDIRSIEY